MKALLIPIYGPVQDIELDGTLEQLQRLVDGDIEAVPLPEFVDPDGRATAYVNEEGKLLEFPLNSRATDLFVPGVGLMWGDYIAGELIVCGFDPETGEHAELPPAVERRILLIAKEAA